MNEKRPIDAIYLIYRVKNARQLEDLATKVDQHLMLERQWDYQKFDCGNNELMWMLESVDRTGMSHEENYYIDQIIWLWYHHAASCALFTYRDQIAARRFAAQAISYQERMPAHPNKITRILYYLTHGLHEKAQQWVQSFPVDDVEAETAAGLLADYQMAFCLKV